MRIGIIREGKIPPDSRVPLTPQQCANIQKRFPVQMQVAASPNRCFTDAEYVAQNVTLNNDVSDCDFLMGVKEVPIEQLIPDKAYSFFSHTIKKQAYNRKLLQAILEKNIRMIDYEVLTNERGKRLIAFGRFAGMVGAHNALWTYSQRTGRFNLKRMKDCKDYAEAQAIYQNLKLPPLKIVLTGTGRVGMGAADVLKDMGIEEVEPGDFLTKSFPNAVFTQLLCHHYAERKDKKEFDKKDFYQHPERYKSIFRPYTRVADIMINGIYWDSRAPAFFSKEEMKALDFNVQVISDVTCDIAPVSSIPSTLRASTIADPVFGYNPLTEKEDAPYQGKVIDMMTIDNLPNELPRDASTAFGKQFIDSILKPLLQGWDSPMIKRATIAANGKLTERYQYLQDFVDGK